MTAGDFVATLIAPAGTILSETQIAGFAAQLAKSGAHITRTEILSAGQAADIFFTDHATILPRPSRAGVGGGGLSSRIYDSNSQTPHPAEDPHPLLPAREERGSPDTDRHVLDDRFFDLIIQPTATRRKKILIADMESTIIVQEMLDELAAEIGIGEHVAGITRRAMNGEIDFAAALAERVALLKGQPESLLTTVAARMTLMPGAQQLVAAMKRSGAHCWLVSGGFACFVRIIADRLGFDRFFANELIVENGIITGRVAPPILDKNTKKELLNRACAEYGCTLAQTLAIGDGANDVPMLLACDAGGGLGVAFRAKPKVREIIHSQINHCDLSALVYAMGLYSAFSP